MLTKEDGLLDFGQPARLVSARARGVDPWPGAFASLGDQPLKLFGPTVMPGQGDRGEVLGLTPAGLSVACAEGAVAFAELQLPGRKRLPAAAVLAGHPIAAGTRLQGKG
jgi:methionyl-tRNA formyltransferase